MMLSAPRIIAIDDELKHLEGLARGLNKYGAACLQLHFTGDIADIKSCPHVRIIFADLHLSGGGAVSDHAKEFGLIGSVIEETIKPSGPYFIVLWTRYPDQATALHEVLEQRLQGVTKPFAVLSLNKTDHLDEDGNVKDTEKLVEAIVAVVGEQPQIGALLNWEERVLGAAADTVASIVSLAIATAEPAHRASDVGRLLAKLGVEGVGQEHVEQDRFHAVNEALLPILADRISRLRSRNGDDEIWKDALSEADVLGALSPQEAAKLNQFLHVAIVTETNTGAERGAVIPLPDTFSGTKFSEAFSLGEEVAAANQFYCMGFVKDDCRFHWVLVQSQAACDYAQTQAGPTPYYLGLDLPETAIAKKGRPPAALWTSLPFELEEASRLLHVSARFQISLPSAISAQARPLFRLREQLLNDLIYKLHSYGARPGIISFRERKAKQREGAGAAAAKVAG